MKFLSFFLRFLVLIFFMYFSFTAFNTSYFDTIKSHTSENNFLIFVLISITGLIYCVLTVLEILESFLSPGN